MLKFLKEKIDGVILKKYYGGFVHGQEKKQFVIGINIFQQ